MTDFTEQANALIAQDGQGALAEPRHVPKSAWLGHIPFAFWIVERLRPAKIVELGTHTGASYFAFCQAVDELKLLATCHAVDTWKGDEHAGFYDDDVFRSVKAINSTHYSGFSQLLRMTFDEGREHIADGSVDLLHIDGLHTYEAVRHDFDHWLPKLSDRAVVLLHDTRITRSEFGVYRLFAELGVRYPCFEFLHSAGLGVVFVGKDHDRGILAALAGEGSAVPATDITRMLFRRLGERIDLSCRIGDEGDEISGMNARLRAQVEEMTARLEEFERKSSEQERRAAEILELNEKLAEARTEVDAARLLQGEIDQMKIAHARREKEFSRQTADLARVEDLLIEVQAEKERIEEKGRGEKALRTFLYIHSKRRLEPLHYRMATRKALGLLRNSKDFDAEWYLTRYPDVKESGVDPVEHYYFSGAFEGRNPSAAFNTLQYLLAHPDVTKAGINPLLHYIRNGKKENRKVEPAENGE